MDFYGTTPPVNNREIRRSKNKSVSKNRRRKSNERDGLDEKKQDKPRVFDHGKSASKNGACSERDNYMTDYSSMQQLDLSVLLSAPKACNRKKDTKNLKTSRTHERDWKVSASDLPNLLTQLDLSPTDGSPVEVESEVVKPPVAPSGGAASAPASHTCRVVPPTVAECPTDRVNFYRTFSLLINLGTSTRKEKERQISPYLRQLSCEQEEYQSELNDLIWLELKAWRDGFTAQQQQQQTDHARGQVSPVLDRITQFRFTDVDASSDSKSCDDNGATSDVDDDSRDAGERSRDVADEASSGVDALGDDGDTSYDASSDDRCQLLDSCLQSMFDAIPLREACVCQQVALAQVCEVLSELEGVERLYPSTRALGRHHPTYNTPVFQQRMETLCLWMNITQDIAHKLQLMAKVLHVDGIRGLNWPYKDVRISLASVHPGMLRSMPEIHVTAESDDGDASDDDDEDASDDASDDDSDDDSEEPRVQFDIYDDPSPIEGSASPCVFPTNSVNLKTFTRTSIYRNFVESTLKKTSLCKLLTRLKRLLDPTLKRACSALEMPKVVLSYADVVSQQMLTPSPMASRKSSCTSLDWGYADGAQSLAARGSHSAAFTDMCLPSFKPTYLFLVRILVDVIHECLRLRLEHRPEMEPSLLSVRQLIHECKEVLLGAVKVKQYYQFMVLSVISSDCQDQTKLDLELFEEDMKSMLEVYFDYIQTWVSGLQNLREMSKRLKNFLEDEWNFTKKVCPHIRSGEANAANRFCLLASSLLHSISDFLDTGMDECVNELYNSTLVETSGDSEQQLFRHSRSGELRQAIIQTCRLFKILFHEARERASKALGFAKMLRKDLEVAADFNIASTATELLQKLKDTQHVRLVAPLSHGYLMFVPSRITDDPAKVLQLLNATCGRDGTTADVPAPDGYLVLVRCQAARGATGETGGEEGGLCPVWTGATQRVEPTAETTIALSYIQVEALLLVVVQSCQLVIQRDQFSDQMGSVVQLVSEQTSCHQAIAESLSELKAAAIDLREKVAMAISQVDDKLHLEDIAELDELEKIEKLYRETLHQCYSFGFEYHQEVTRLLSGESRAQLSRMLVVFAKQWMQFVSKKCERGRGLRPRWASQGLDFLIVACEPKVLAMLSETEYLELKTCINSCISHVIGNKATGIGSGYRPGAADAASQRHHVNRNISCPEPAAPPSRRSSILSTRSAQSEPPYSPGGDIGDRRMTSPAVFPGDVRVSDGENGSVDGGSDGGLVMHVTADVFRTRCADVLLATDEAYSARVKASIDRLEADRNQKLCRQHAIGKVTRWRGDSDYMSGSRRVNFKWQRGNKIGEGQYGKVYAAVNMESGELMAVKELTFQANDQRTIKYIADEIKIFESISHPNLVKYYGTEVHRGEMLIFMEYCAEGTIEEVAKQGLSEGMVRKYTEQLLIAVNVLHEHGIVHRDIKGANIFLTSNGPLKLGDFGSAVQLRAHNTMPGEVGPMVGTAAFMAPEVITRHHSQGTGRAADIWSIGCVVLQMLTGKRPWHEMENKMTIMFRVGQGGIPSFPDHLSEEGRHFLSHCLVHNPEDRWTASHLLDLPFAKVYMEEEEGESISGIG